MLTPDQIEDAKLEATAKFQAKLRKEAIDAHIKVLEGRRAHLFPKRLVFQWPWRTEEWVKPSACSK